MLVTDMGIASGLAVQPSPKDPAWGEAEGMEVVSTSPARVRPAQYRSAGTVLHCLTASLPSAQGRPAQGSWLLEGWRAGLGGSWETPAATQAHWLEPTLLPASPCFLWSQDFRLSEEIEALLQGEVASPGCFTG